MADADAEETAAQTNEPVPAESLDGPADDSTEIAPEKMTGASDDVSDEGTPAANDDAVDARSPAAANQTATPAPKRKRHWWQRINIYALFFVLVLMLAGVIMLIAYLQNHRPATNHFQTQNLTQKTLDQLANGDVTVGSNQSILNVQSSAVFAGQVLIRQNLQVAGNLQLGGTLTLNNLSVAGTSQFGQANVTKNLAVTGDNLVQGAVTIGKSLQVGSSGTFGGPLSAPQITTSNLQLNGDLVLTHHLTIGGATPGRSSGPALGGGGSVSISGSDTSGSISINTGSGPAAGCFVTVNFTTHFNDTPHVLITPIGSAAGGLSYYVTRSASSFSICDASSPPAGSSFGFDYFVLG